MLMRLLPRMPSFIQNISSLNLKLYPNIYSHIDKVGAKRIVVLPLLGLLKDHEVTPKVPSHTFHG